jgi:membrane associated rhomboid family serine protease
MLGTEVGPRPMSYTQRPRVNRYAGSNRFPTGLKWLLITNVSIFVITFFLQATDLRDFFDHFALVPSLVVTAYAIWQPFTYMFIHSTGDFFHILWNMLVLWMFGAELERLWGTRRFLYYYFACGVGAAICVILCAYAFSGVNTRTIGASGAIMGILLAYALLFPDRVILFGFLIPIKVKYFVMIIGAITFMQSFMVTVGGMRGGSVAVVCHLGGLLTGFLLMRGPRLRLQLTNPIQSGVKEWRLRRAKKKFEVYLKKNGSGGNRMVH